MGERETGGNGRIALALVKGRLGSVSVGFVELICTLRQLSMAGHRTGSTGRDRVLLYYFTYCYVENKT